MKKCYVVTLKEVSFILKMSTIVIFATSIYLKCSFFGRMFAVSRWDEAESGKTF